MKKRLLGLLTVLSLLGCKKDVEETPEWFTEREVDLTVTVNNCSESAGGVSTHAVCFDQLVEDSRCPSNVVCVWSGVAVAQFSVRLNPSQHRFSLSTLKAPAFPPNDTLIAGYRFKLVDVLAYPGSGAPGPVRAVLHISH